MLKINEILKILNAHKVKYVVIGGTAAIAQGSAHLTFDFDFCYATDNNNLENIVKALKPFHPNLRGADKDLPFIFDAKTLKMGLNFTFTTDIGDIDLLGEITELGNYDEVMKFSEIIELYGMQCNVLTIEGLIKSKKATARQKDEAIIKELEALQEIRKQKQGKI